MRAADVPEYVQDGVVDCGITGIDLVRERGAEVHELLPLGFGSCRLEAAVPEESTVDVARGARRRARRHRLSAADARAAAGRRELVDVTGSVEIAPRLGLADAIVDLVSSGNTLRTNGLRSLGVAARVGGGARRARRRGGGAVRGDAARGRRGAAAPLPDAERAARSRCPRSRARRPRVPSVLPLAEAGMVAVHALVPSADVWRLLPELEAAGGSSILIVPVERMAHDDRRGVKERGLEAVREWAVELDGVEPVRASAAGASRARRSSRSPTASAAGTRCSGRPTSRWRSSRASCSSGAGCRSTRSGSTCRATSSRRSSCAPCRRRSPACGASSSARRRRAPGSIAAAAELLGLDEVWALGGPQAIG